MLTKTMEWTLDICLTDFVFTDEVGVQQRFLRAHQRARLIAEFVFARMNWRLTAWDAARLLPLDFV